MESDQEQLKFLIMLEISLQSELELEAHLAALHSSSIPAPLSFAEQELADIKQELSGANAGVDEKHATMKNIAFPLTCEAEQAVSAFHSGSVHYAQFGVDLPSESVVLLHSETRRISLEELRKLTPENAGRYHLFRFLHRFGNADYSDDLLIYSVPGYRAHFKERMLASSGKSAFIAFCEAQNILFARKVRSPFFSGSFSNSLPIDLGIVNQV